MPPASSGSTPLPKLAMVAGAVGASLSGVTVTYGQGSLVKPTALHTSSMTPQDQELILARVDAKMADLRGDVRLNTEALGNLKERFGELALRMTNVPSEMAALKTKVDALPGKGFVVTAAIGSVTGLTALLILLQKLGILT